MFVSEYTVCEWSTYMSGTNMHYAYKSAATYMFNAQYQVIGKWEVVWKQYQVWYWTKHDISAYREAHSHHWVVQL